ncbi:MAG: hypothetical protein KDE63_04925, partial [Novosphingobium sp.]|nr:hypothetical protein [Novosphingobium sp.]
MVLFFSGITNALNGREVSKAPFFRPPQSERKANISHPGVSGKPAVANYVDIKGSSSLAQFFQLLE